MIHFSVRKLMVGLFVFLFFPMRNREICSARQLFKSRVITHVEAGIYPIVPKFRYFLPRRTCPVG
jgi:hypothetical protein